MVRTTLRTTRDQSIWRDEALKTTVPSVVVVLGQTIYTSYGVFNHVRASLRKWCVQTPLSLHDLLIGNGPFQFRFSVIDFQRRTENSENAIFRERSRSDLKTLTMIAIQSDLV